MRQFIPARTAVDLLKRMPNHAEFPSVHRDAGGARGGGPS